MDPRFSGWLPDAGVVVTAVTMVVVLLLLRAIDDIRDRAYDREHNPGRPLASGAVRVADLAVLLAAGTVLVLAVNAWRWPVMCVLAGLLGYALVLLWADRRLGWPPGDALGLGMLVSTPVQIGINLYLYAGLLHADGLAPSWRGAGGVAVAMTAFLHLEFARKTTRRPRSGERTYVHLFGVTGTAVLSVAAAVVSVALLVAAAAPWAGGTPWIWLAAAPLGLVGWGAAGFWRERRTHWPVGAAALFLLSSFAGYLLVGLLERIAAP